MKVFHMIFPAFAVGALDEMHVLRWILLLRLESVFLFSFSKWVKLFLVLIIIVFLKKSNSYTVSCDTDRESNPIFGERNLS